MPAGQSAHEVWGSLPPGGTIREARAALAALHLQHLNRLLDLKDSVLAPSLHGWAGGFSDIKRL